MTESLLWGIRRFVSVLRLIAGVLLIASVLINFANVIGRYFFSASIHWAEEIMLYLMVGCVFLGNGVVAWSGRQIRMDVIIGMMPAKARAMLDLFSELLMIATAVALMVFSWPVIRDLWAFEQRSQSADVLMVLLVVLRLLTGGDHDSHKAGH